MFEQPIVDPSLIVEPAKFAREQTAAAGMLAARALPRLAEQLFDQKGHIEYRVSGFLTPKQQPGMRLEIHCEIDLRCQRCLGRLGVALDLRREIVLVDSCESFGQPVDEDDGVDTIPAVSRLDLGELIEEEILLSLPMVPRHADGGCHARTLEQGVEHSRASTQASSPWAALAKLRQ